MLRAALLALATVLLLQRPPDGQRTACRSLAALACLQGAHNLAAADAAGLNRLLIDWLQSTVAAPDGSSDGGAEQGAAEAAPQAQLLQQQLLALLRLSGSYSIAAPDLRSLLQLLRAGADGRPPPHAAALLEVRRPAARPLPPLLHAAVLSRS